MDPNTYVQAGALMCGVVTLTVVMYSTDIDCLQRSVVVSYYMAQSAIRWYVVVWELVRLTMHVLY